MVEATTHRFRPILLTAAAANRSEMASVKVAKTVAPAQPLTIITPADLNKMEEEREAAAAREALEKKRQAEQEQRALHEAFLTTEIGPEAIERFNAAVVKATEQGRREIMIGQFPASWCTDGGRRINNAQEDWPPGHRQEGT